MFVSFHTLEGDDAQFVSIFFLNNQGDTGDDFDEWNRNGMRARAMTLDASDLDEDEPDQLPAAVMPTFSATYVGTAHTQTHPACCFSRILD